MALTAFRQAQFAKETSPGVRAAGAVFRRLLGRIQADRGDRVHTPQDDFPGLAMSKRSFVVDRNTTLSYQVDVNYENIMDFLGMTISNDPNITFANDVDGVITENDVAGAKSYNRIYQAYKIANDVLSIPGLDSYTVQFGDDEAKFESLFVGCRSLEFSMTQAGPVSMRADLFGQGLVDLVSFSDRLPAASRYSETPILADSTAIYTRPFNSADTLDEIIGTAGWTKIPKSVTGASVRVNSGAEGSRYLDGSQTLSYTAINQMRRSHTSDIDVVLKSGADEAKAQLWDKYDPDEENLEKFWIKYRNQGPTAADGTAKFTFDTHLFGSVVQATGLYQDVSGENGARVSFESRDNDLGDCIVVITNNESL